MLKKIILLSICVLLIIVSSILIVSFTITSFSDGSSSGSLTYTASDDQYLNLNLPKYINVTSAQLNVTGTSSPTTGTEANTDGGGSAVSYTMTTDGASSTAFGQTFNSTDSMDVYRVRLYLYTDSPSGATCTMTVDIRATNPSGANVCTSTTSRSATTIDLDNPAWENFNFANCQLSAGTIYALVLRNISATGCANGDDHAIWNDVYNEDKYGGTGLHLYHSNDNQGSWLSVTNRDLVFNVQYYDQHYFPNNVTINAGNDSDVEFNHTGKLNTTNRTANFASEVNDYLSTCTASDGNCTVPIKVHSDSRGIIDYEDLSVSYDDVKAPVYGTSVITGTNKTSTTTTFNTTWSDNFGLSGWNFRHDQTGTMANQTLNTTWVGAGSNASVYYLPITLTRGNQINWGFCANDSSNNWNCTPDYTLTVANTAPATPSLSSPADTISIEVNYVLFNWTSSLDVDSDSFNFYLYSDTNANPTTLLAQLNSSTTISFNDSTTSKSLNFSSGGDQYVYFNLPKNTKVLNANMSITSGVGASNKVCFQETATTQSCGAPTTGAYSCEGNFSPSNPCAKGYDGNDNTGFEVVNTTETSSVYINYSKADNVVMSDTIWQTREYLTDENESIDLACYNWTNMLQLQWTHIPYTFTGWKCYTGSSWTNIDTSATSFREERMYWYQSFAMDVTMDTGNDSDYEFNHTSYLETTNKTIDLSTEINDYLATCTAINGNCSVPIKISASDGIVNLSAVTISFVDLTYNRTSIADGTYYWKVQADDSFDNGSNSTIWSYTIATTSPAINLDYPSNNAFINTTINYFNFTATDVGGISICRLYGNWSGSWNINQTLTGVSSGIETNFSPKTLTEGTYKWNVWCNDSSDNGGFSPINRTFTTDIYYPELNVTTPTNDATYYVNTTTLTISASDTFLDKCYYELYFQDAGLKASNTSINCTGSTSISTPIYANGYRLVVYANDTSGQVNSTEINFTITDAPATPPSGGGGGGGGGDDLYDCNESRFRIETTTGKNLLDFFIVPSGVKTQKTLLFNDMLNRTNVTISCQSEDGLCNSTEFSESSFSLSPNALDSESFTITLKAPPESKEKLFLSIIGTDENKCTQKLDVNVNVGYNFFSIGTKQIIFPLSALSENMEDIAVPAILVGFITAILFFIISQFIFVKIKYASTGIIINSILSILLLLGFIII